MGKRLNQQRRGKGSPTWRVPSHRFWGAVKLPVKQGKGVVLDLVRDAIHSAPLALIKWEDGTEFLLPAAHGIAVGDIIEYSQGAEVKPGNVLPLGAIPEGTRIFNIELQPGDGGKLVRTAGSFAIVVGKEGDEVAVKLPSGAIKRLDARCRAVVGTVAGAGITEKPILKAGKKFHIMRAKNKYWPRVAAASMNAVEHPFGGGRVHRHTGKPETTSRNAPPGRKVGYIAARRTGRRKR